jgi:L-seryl-tRNA(Ser) seleniumtransferase
VTEQRTRNVYEELGVRPVINAGGSLTRVGGSSPPPEVREAMEAASSSFVLMEELEERAGEAIARELRVPAAYVTSGAASALTLATAALMAGDDLEKIQRLPNTTGMRNEILIQVRQHYWYDRCLELAGAKLVEFGTPDGTTRDDLARAIGPRTAAVHYLAKSDSRDPAALSLEETIEIANEAGVPVMVDGAGQVYPLDELGEAVRKGAVFQAIAAKYMGAPHSSGIALGTSEMVRNIALQSFAGYETHVVRGVGRPHKVDRQEIVGVVAAVRRWMTLNHEERLAEAESKSCFMADALQGIPGVEAKVMDNVAGPHAFGVFMKIDSSVTGLSVTDVQRKLKEGEPSIWVWIRTGEDAIRINTVGLKPDEELIVADRVRALFV